MEKKSHARATFNRKKKMKMKQETREQYTMCEHVEYERQTKFNPFVHIIQFCWLHDYYEHTTQYTYSFITHCVWIG